MPTAPGVGGDNADRRKFARKNGDLPNGAREYLRFGVEFGLLVFSSMCAVVPCNHFWMDVSNHVGSLSCLIFSSCHEPMLSTKTYIYTCQLAPHAILNRIEMDGGAGLYSPVGGGGDCLGLFLFAVIII